jgi:hypothetical protein
MDHLITYMETASKYLRKDLAILKAEEAYQLASVLSDGK